MDPFTLAWPGLGLRGMFDPWRGIEELYREVDRLFRDTLGGFAEWGARAYPALNVWTDEEGATVTALLPGVDASQLEVTVDGDQLRLHGSREASGVEGDPTWHRRERFSGDFRRTLQLPFPVEPDKVTATFSHGVLRIELPRLEADKPRRIQVASGS
ncbi:MAG: molecular chaperone Hsp20 [Planctomycetota bacterium]|nr:MAG: molecular chaperone Hsp20 [Planctomycetota bacterium]